MKNLLTITGLAATACLLGLTSNLVLAQNATTLAGLLDLVENDRIAESLTSVLLSKNKRNQILVISLKLTKSSSVTSGRSCATVVVP
jgi:hypothetical protein